MNSRVKNDSAGGSRKDCAKNDRQLVKDLNRAY
jgi:hypothetical protein